MLGWEENPLSPCLLTLNVESQHLCRWGGTLVLLCPGVLPSPAQPDGHGLWHPVFAALGQHFHCSQLFPGPLLQNPSPPEGWGMCQVWQHPPVLHVPGNYSPAAPRAELSRNPGFIAQFCSQLRAADAQAVPGNLLSASPAGCKQEEWPWGLSLRAGGSQEPFAFSHRSGCSLCTLPLQSLK